MTWRARLEVALDRRAHRILTQFTQLMGAMFGFSPLLATIITVVSLLALWWCAEPRLFPPFGKYFYFR